MLFILKMTNKCNLTCGYCHSRGDSIGDVRSVFNKMKDFLTYGDEVILHGGEPLLIDYDTIEEILAFDKCRIRSLQTNLTLLTDRHIELFKKYGVGIGTSFDGFCGSRGSHDIELKVVENIERLKSSGVSVNVICVVSDKNAYDYQSTRNTFNQVASLNTFIRWNYCSGMENMASYWDKDAHIQLFKLSIPLMVEKGMSVRPFENFITSASGLFPFNRECSNHMCRLKNGIFGIMPNGNVTFCCKSKDVTLGNIFNTPFPDIIDSFDFSKYQERYKILRDGDCKGCQAWAVCQGGCMGDAPGIHEKAGTCESTRAIFDYMVSGEMERDFPEYDFMDYCKRAALKEGFCNG